MSPTSYPRIAILGGGPVGLTLASLLHKSEISFTLFELRPYPLDDPTSSTSPQVISSSLDLHDESGLRALRECGLYEKFRALGSVCTEETIIANKHGARRYRVGAEQEVGWDGVGSRPEIARNALTGLLLDSLASDSEQQTSTLKWSSKVLSIQPSTPGSKTYTITYTDFSSIPATTLTQEYDIVLGAEGAWSRLRSLVTDTTPHHSSVSCITLTIPSFTSTYPHLAAFAGTGTLFSLAAERSLIVQRGSFDSARIYLMLRDPAAFPTASSLRYTVPSSPSSSPTLSGSKDEKEDNAYLAQQHLLNLSPSELQHALLSPGGLYSTWSAEHRALISAGCASGEEISIKGLYMLPIDHTWPHRRGITLLGDAAHLMTPFAGEGVNMGMLDAVEVAELLVPALRGVGERQINGEGERSGEDEVSEDQAEEGSVMDRVDRVLEVYERGMFERMRGMAQGTWDNLEMIFHEESPEPMVGFFKSMGGGGDVGVPAAVQVEG